MSFYSGERVEDPNPLVFVTKFVLMGLGIFLIVACVAFRIFGPSETERDKETVVDFFAEVAPDHHAEGLYDCFKNKGQKPLVLGRHCAVIVTSEAWENPPALRGQLDCMVPLELVVREFDGGNRAFCLEVHPPH